jgi:hypothetical protein
LRHDSPGHGFDILLTLLRLDQEVEERSVVPDVVHTDLARSEYVTNHPANRVGPAS